MQLEEPELSDNRREFGTVNPNAPAANDDAD
jgi:hypothetical protein